MGLGRKPEKEKDEAAYGLMKIKIKNPAASLPG